MEEIQLNKPWKLTPRRLFYKLYDKYIVPIRGSGRRRFLLRELPRGAIGCEIGVWRGRFTKYLIDIAKPERLFLVDPWAYQPQYPHAMHGGAEVSSQKEMDEICQDIADRFGSRSGVSIVRKKTEQLTTDDIADEIVNCIN